MKLNVVLVRSEYSNNVGAVARAMANMGADRLILMAPQCPLDYSARQGAAGAQAHLDHAVIYSSWNEFMKAEGEGLRLAFTRRSGDRRRVFPLSEKLSEGLLASSTDQEVHLIFGPEADGLSREDLAFCNLAVHLPVFGDFGSFNLAQAVLLALFMVRQSTAVAPEPREMIKGKAAAVTGHPYFPDQILREWLLQLGFNLESPKTNAFTTLRRLLLQNQPTPGEVSVLESVLQQTVRKLRNRTESLGFAFKKVTDDSGDVTGQKI